MAAYTRLAPEMAVSVGRAFGLEVCEARPVAAGAVNSNYRLTLDNGEAVFARIYEEQDQRGAEGEARLLDHLAGRGVKTPRPLPRSDGSGFTFLLDAAESGLRPVALFRWVGGRMLCQASVTETVAREVGTQLARVHLAAAGFQEARPGRFRVEDIRARLASIERSEDDLLRALVPRIVERLDRASAERDAGLPRRHHPRRSFP